MQELVSSLMNFVVTLFTAGSLHTSPDTVATAGLPLPTNVPGGIALVNVGYGLQAPAATFNKQPVMVIRPDPQQEWIAVVGIPLTQKTGSAVVRSDGHEYAFTVSARRYPEQHLTVQNKHVNPDPEQLARINREMSAMMAVYQSFTPSSGWAPFAWPATGPMSSDFGLRRFFNGEERAPHSGVDIAVPEGTEVLAPADGTIALTGDFFFNGNSVFIDHGQGLITMYCHLSSIEVKEGEHVFAGDRLGLSGQTGRATGPHLHWTASLNNTRINPLLLLSPYQSSLNGNGMAGTPAREFP